MAVALSSGLRFLLSVEREREKKVRAGRAIIPLHIHSHMGLARI